MFGLSAKARLRQLGHFTHLYAELLLGGIDVIDFLHWPPRRSAVIPKRNAVRKARMIANGSLWLTTGTKSDTVTLWRFDGQAATVAW